MPNGEQQDTLSPYLSMPVPGQSAICIKFPQHIFHLQAAIWKQRHTGHTGIHMYICARRVALKQGFFIYNSIECNYYQSTSLKYHVHIRLHNLSGKKTKDVHALFDKKQNVANFYLLDMRNHEQVSVNECVCGWKWKWRGGVKR